MSQPSAPSSPGTPPTSWRTYPLAADPSAAGGLEPTAGRTDWAAMSWPAAPTDYVPPGYRADDPLVIAAGVGSAKKDGRWTVPPHLLLEGGMGSIRLDCRLAQAAGPVVNLDVIGSLGSILIILPPGWGATMDRLVPGLGGQSATSKVDSQPDEGQPLLVFSGRLGLGSLVVRHPSRWERWRLRRRLAREASRQLGAAGQL